MPTLYVLLCESNRYYIGKTDRPLKKRIEEHFGNNGSEWTRKYKPIKVIKTIPNADDFDEDKYTKMYMKQYGIDKVRGGSYVQMILPEHSTKTLQKELCNASNLCFRCNRSGHFAAQCYAKTTVDGGRISDDEDITNDESSDDEDSEEETYYCEYCQEEFQSYVEAKKHAMYCRGETIIPGITKTVFNGFRISDEFLDTKLNNKVCFRCARAGHFADSCYAATHVNGRYLR